MESEIKIISLHFIGNKSADEGLCLSETTLFLNDKIKKLLVNYFL